ncbi:ubiquitin carboxyl-terminal hydrolase 5/13 [Marchantia polymorpha subsp. ruderalis]|uniref:Ubiquitin carboxyl-terminal hydrolase n=2 Tax=Marchantia polymorpha TaxID=3197 RepID=A0A176VP45_MARPO|nr:hypothetical protein AXG93_2381s1230 [Marchantia polymorpha subsp. ruderalis]PTQ42770.1 hypothetical protein MARPO_0028s0083 [Marchantia polymorpha]BBN00627.1 hypothetical protein Mp_2g00680 [Marchantia polymorpha subsp. ruderalis]|eukprot:PTQ42770.1 hypothetical protein MARPO_0028s0083 [Marchantia polymorpha]
MGVDAAMELLRARLNRVRIPEPSNRIYKQECCISFQTPRSEGGLFVDLNSFLAFGREYVMWNHKKTGNSVYLNIKERPKPVSEDRPHKKPTLLAIGVDGGFDTKETEYEEFYNIVLLPEFVSLPFPSVELPEKVRLAVDGVLAAVGAERKEEVSAWTAGKKQVSESALNLQQLDNGVKVAPTGWKCSKCDKTENLWLNLTDGMINCGRRNWDGSGGNGHAVEHYLQTKYPLAVKLGTITADLDSADVYSYEDDETVEDPMLAQHLEHFGIDFSSLQKTEMTTAERELDQNVNFDWNRIQEKGKELQPLFGPGYTGLANLGNSCYLASIMQAVFSTKDFQQYYYMNAKLDDAFERAPADPTLDLNTQLTKLAHGILSGKYSCPSGKVTEKEEEEDEAGKLVQKGIPPRMFKSLIGTGHPEFASARQQDALEFFQHFLEQVERNHSMNSLEDPSRAFKFYVEERIMCSTSRKVRYTRKIDNVLSLNIPLHAAVNKDEINAFQKLKAEKEQLGEKLEVEEFVRPRVPLAACLECFFAPEEVQDFYSTATNSRTTAIKTSRLVTFPDYLVLHMRKFLLDAGWVPRKLDVFIDVPDEIDISYMRGKGLQPDEELLPETGEPEESGPSADEGIVAQLMDMGFPRVRCQKAALNTSNTGVEEAMNWLLSHMDDPDIDMPLTSGNKSSTSAVQPTYDQSHVDTLISFGFPEDVARKALTVSGGDVERAAEWICSHPDDIVAMELDVTTSREPSTSSEQPLPDGSGKYQLLAFVSHMGTSTQNGHYVVHVRKEGRWVIYNDSKVALSGDPPKDMGYLYFFQRVAS